MKFEHLPKNQFAIVKNITDDFLMLASVNKGYSKYKFKINYPFHVFISIEFEQITETGMPTKDENKRLIELEEIISNRLKEKANIHWIGHLTWNGLREIFYYTDEPFKINNEMEKIFSDNIIPYESWEYEIIKDESWDKVDFLLNTDSPS